METKVTVYYHAESGTFCFDPMSEQELEDAANSGNEVVPMDEKDLVAMITRLQIEIATSKDSHRRVYQDIMGMAEQGVNGDSKHSKNFALSRIHGLAKEANNIT